MKELEFKYFINILFLVIPAAVLVVLILGNRKKEKIMKGVNIKIRDSFKGLRNVLIVSGLAFMVFSLMGPQIFKGVHEIEGEGLDIYVLIDTSKSMLVEDVKPSRINRALKITENIIDNLGGDRIGFIPFSSSAYVQMPLTDDYNMAKMFLNVVDTEMISGGGSDIGNAVKLAQKSFDETSAGNKVVIILSDGEEHDSKSLEAIKSIKDNNLKIYTVGIGTEKGGLIPMYDENGYRMGYKKNKEGDTVISKLNPDGLKEIASIGEGKYYESTIKGEEIGELVKDISSLEKNTFKARKIKQYNQIYQYFLGTGLILFLAGFILPERRREP